ncbi:hypothetical protein E2C01_028211 [Portunus trituberculatus]|uniref:Uncharacterized protein n=1 Tax=Portunus trituberculatus TaxID=210409 RepID=A0A5B7ENQ5_PORTR|nr:hypothetical protein [Portunus trituberculatus]
MVAYRAAAEAHTHPSHIDLATDQTDFLKGISHWPMICGMWAMVLGAKPGTLSRKLAAFLLC